MPPAALTKLTDGNGNLIVQYTYDAAGNLIQKDNGNGTLHGLHLRRRRGRAVDHELCAHRTTSTVNSFDDYTYDALGNVLTDTNQDGEWDYTYDADSQLIMRSSHPTPPTRTG